MAMTPLKMCISETPSPSNCKTAIEALETVSRIIDKPRPYTITVRTKIGTCIKNILSIFVSTTSSTIFIISKNKNK